MERDLPELLLQMSLLMFMAYNRASKSVIRKCALVTHCFHVIIAAGKPEAKRSRPVEQAKNSFELIILVVLVMLTFHLTQATTYVYM